MDLSKDTLAFAREKRRMCKFFTGCVGCDLMGMDESCDLADGLSDEEAHDARILAAVQKFHGEHPQNTYLRDFLSKFPHCTMVSADNVPAVCRDAIYGNSNKPIAFCEKGGCKKCWNEVMP